MKNGNRWAIDLTKIDIKNLTNGLFYVSDGNKIIGLLKRLRDAFAHNNIIGSGDYFILADYYVAKNAQKTKVITMIGKIKKKKLKILIETIVKQKNKVQL